MKTPIVMAVFGTTSRAIDTYSYIDKIIKDRFIGHEIIWAYSSRMVKDRLKKNKNIDLKHPYQVFSELHKKGYLWVVAQSMHIIAGYEFYRLVHDADNCTVRTSIGLPLLSSPADYRGVVDAMLSDVSVDGKEAIVIVGHGTDHPGWSSYLALSYMFREKFGNNIFVGVVEGYPGKENIVQKVKDGGFKKVCLIPFMLISGVHFEEDLRGDEDSWETAFEKEGISISFKKDGIGMNKKVIDIFSKHIEDALDVIP